MRHANIFGIGLVVAALLMASSNATGQFPGGGMPGGGGGFGGGGGYGGNSGIGGGGLRGHPGTTGGTGRGGYQGSSPYIGGGHQPDMPGTYSGDPDPFSPRNNQYGSPAVRRAEPRGGAGYDPTAPYGSRVPQSGDAWAGSGFNNPLYQRQTPYDPTNMRPGSPQHARIYGGSVHAAEPEWQRAQRMMSGGQVRDAQAIIDEQLGRNRSLDGLMNAVSTMEGAGADPSVYGNYRREALQMARSQMGSRPDNPLPYVAVAKFSLEDDDETSFREAANSLAQQFPGDKHSHYFQGIVAAKDQDWHRAEIELQRARELGIPDENISAWLKMAIDNQRWVWQYAWAILWITVGWIAGLVVIFALGKILSWLTLRGLKKQQFAEPARWQRMLRTTYRAVILAAGLYYYLSLPMLVVISIAAPLAVCYALLHVPVISLWLIAVVILVSIGSLLTALSGIRACFVSLDPKLPGRGIPKNENVKLWQLVNDVAQRVGTRPVDTIWLLPTADIGVFERGSFLSRLFDKGERVLILGAGVLEGFSQRALSSVLAHEYGHFQNRDTAGGDVALRVNRAMQNFAESLLRRGKIRWWHLAVQFLRFYYVLFNRLTFGASRLQEVMADRTAVLAYGPAAFQEGLTHSIRRGLEFDYWTENRLQDLIQQQQPALSLVQTAERPGVTVLDGLEKAMSELLSRATTERDTHPSPRDRFAFAKGLGMTDTPDRGEMVWDLFQDPHRLCESANRDLEHLLAGEANLIKAITSARLDYLHEVIRHEPSCEAYEARAQLYLDAGNFEAAHKDLDKSLSRAPHALDARIGKAVTYHAAKDYHRAAAVFAELLKNANSTKARTTDLWFIYGECLRELGDFAGADGAFSEALLLERLAGIQIARGQARLKLGRHASAIDDFSAVIDRLPGSADAYVERAAVYGLVGERAKALADLEKAASLCVAYPRAHREYARLLLSGPSLAREQINLAVRHARIACASALSLAESLPVLVDALAAAGEFAGAARTVERLLPLLSSGERGAWEARKQEFQTKQESLQYSSVGETSTAVWA